MSMAKRAAISPAFALAPRRDPAAGAATERSQGEDRFSRIGGSAKMPSRLRSAEQ